MADAGFQLHHQAYFKESNTVFEETYIYKKLHLDIFYYFKECGGWIDENGYVPPKEPKDLIIITTAQKRNLMEWEEELVPFLLYPDSETKLTRYGNKILIDSWNNIKKYDNITDAFFIFDEDRVTGTGAWVKSFLKIAKANDWIILSATPRRPLGRLYGGVHS